ncbi:MAG: hypothetical protein DME99_01200 [Verrucomicrobia bacterium]|nr:MAG: hypothetical protein DME99_01200 [Verrucomicrobiota bacterium]
MDLHLAMKMNPFAVPVVRLQQERHQRVIDLRRLRGGAASDVCGLCADGHWPGALLLAIVPIAVVGVRSVFEEQFLKRELEGYEIYTHKVRYRLIPSVW